MTERLRVAVLGASGYTGIELIRLLVDHPHVTLAALTGDRAAGQAARNVSRSFATVTLPNLVMVAEVDFNAIDVVFCCLPHATTQEVVLTLPATMPVIDLSADFRLRDSSTYQYWYGRPHQAPDLQADAAYGLTEWNRSTIQVRRITACPGCFPTAILLALIPVLKAGVADPDHLIVDAKTGLSGAGRSPKQAMLLSEAGEGVSAYGLGHHRHMGELEQELSLVHGSPVVVSFTPHLTPMSRGELATCHLKGDPTAIRAALTAAYAEEPFVVVLPDGDAADTISVRGTNSCMLSIHADRRPGHTIVLSAIDNLTKGSSGQAVQNLNLRFGWPEGLGLPKVALFP